MTNIPPTRTPPATLPPMLAALSVEQFRELMAELRPEPEEVLDSAGCAAYLKCSAYTLRELTRKGQIPARKLGGEYRYLRSEVLAALPRITPKPGNIPISKVG